MAQNDFWEKFKSTVKGATNVAADFAEEQALVGKLKFEILTLNRKAKGLRSKLGELVFDMALKTPQPNPFDNAEVNSIISEIEDLLAKSEAKRSEISQVADYFRAKTASEKRDDFFDDEPFEPDTQFTKPFTPPVEEVVKEAPKKAEPRKSEPRKTQPRSATPKKAEQPKAEPRRPEPIKAEAPKVEEKPAETETPADQKSDAPKHSRTSSSTRRPRSKSPSSRGRSSARRSSSTAEDKTNEATEKSASSRKSSSPKPEPEKKDSGKETPDKPE